MSWGQHAIDQIHDFCFSLQVRNNTLLERVNLPSLLETDGTIDLWSPGGDSLG